MIFLATATTEAVSSQDAVAGGFAVGLTLGILITMYFLWFLLQVIADWKIFTKAGKAGWKSLIPIYSSYVEYDICWNAPLGLIYALGIFAGGMVQINEGTSYLVVLLVCLLGVASLVLHFMESTRLAKAFGKGTGFGIALFLIGPIMRLILGYGSAQYVGKPED